MLKIVLKIFKRVIFSAFLLYGYNVLIQPVGLIVPINFITIGILSFLGIPSFLCLIFIAYFIY